MTLSTKSCSGCGTLILTTSPHCPSCGSAQKPPSVLVPGTIFDSKYEVENLLGQGGMGEVYKVKHSILGAYRCIKVMKKALLIDEGFKGRFLREAVLATKINHPNVALVYDFSTLADGTCYMVSEFIDGTTLRKWVATKGVFSPAAAVEVMFQVLDGLDQIHRRGLLHRDISSENVMLTSDSDDRLVAKIIDLGIAKQVGGSVSAGEGTQVGMFVGNPKYASPEQFGFLKDGEMVDARADLYCLGVVTYEMVTGQPPYRAQTPQGYAMKHLRDQPPPLAEACPNVAWPPGFEACIFKALEKDREDRYASAREFREALQPFRQWSSPPHINSLVGPVDPDAEAMPSTDRSGESYESHADTAFSRAVSVDSSEAFRSFLNAYSKSSLATEARRALEERLDFEAAARTDTEDGWRKYLAKRQDDTHAAAAKSLMARARKREEEAWLRAETVGTKTALNSFLAKYPEAGVAETARQLLQEVTDFERAESGGRGTLEQVLKRYPISRFAPSARARLEAIAQEEKFAEASRLDSVTAWRLFLGEFPDAPQAGNVRVRLASLEAKEYREVLKSADIEQIDDFLRRFPETAKRRELLGIRGERSDKKMCEAAQAALQKKDFNEAESLARKVANPALQADLHMRIEAAIDAADWSDAEKEGTVDAYTLYLRQHPGGVAAAKAQERIERTNRAAAEQSRKEQEERAATAAAQARREEESRAAAAAAHARREEESRAAAAAQQRVEEQARAAEKARLEEEGRRQAAAQRRREEEDRAALQRAAEEARSAELAAESTSIDSLELPTLVNRALEVEAEPTIITPIPAPLIPARLPVAAEREYSPAPRTLPGSEDRPEAVRSRSRLAIPIAAVLLVAVILAAVFFRHGANPPPQVLPMKLRLDSVPWAQISSIKGDDGKEYLATSPAYTPMQVDLPPGRYQIVFTRDQKSVTRSVDVKEPQQIVKAGFEPLNPSDYFKEAGW